MEQAFLNQFQQTKFSRTTLPKILFRSGSESGSGRFEESLPDLDYRPDLKKGISGINTG
jgi:hypothetical protein